MTTRDLCYWLQGFLELGGGANGLTAEQVDIVRRHLALVFKTETAVPTVLPIGVGWPSAPLDPFTWIPSRTSDQIQITCGGTDQVTGSVQIC
jgi:hypothetical protein